MLRKYFILVVGFLIAQQATAQQIKPYDLLQLYKYSQSNDAKFGQSAYQYLMTVDTGWKLTTKLITDESSVTADFAYTKTGKSWYQPESYHLMITRAFGPPVKHVIIYSFKEVDLWNSYLDQMQVMNAIKMHTTPFSGGTKTIYILNDIGFALVDFPPGIQGPERTFEVMISTNSSN